MTAPRCLYLQLPRGAGLGNPTLEKRFPVRRNVEPSGPRSDHLWITSGALSYRRTVNEPDIDTEALQRYRYRGRWTSVASVAIGQMATNIMQRLDLGSQAAHSLGHNDHINCKEREQTRLPCQALLIRGFMQLCPLSC